MKFEGKRFCSDGLTLDGGFFLPDDLDAGEPHPLIIPCSGFTGLMRIHPARFARSLTARGWMCFGFDYRGFGDSQGPRGRVLLDEQVRDILHGAAFAADDPRVDPQRIVLLGWGMAGGLILDAACAMEPPAGLIVANGFYDGPRVQRAHRGEGGLRRFIARAAAHRTRCARTGEAAATDPFDLYPLDERSRRYVDEVLRPTPGYDAQPYDWALADSLLRWRPEAHAGELDTPLLIIHGDQNALHPPAEATSLYEAYRGPKELYWVEGGGHTEWMLDEDPKFQSVCAAIDRWLGQHLHQTAT